VFRVEARPEPGVVELRPSFADDVDLDGGIGREGDAEDVCAVVVNQRAAFT
jgi:hypothetical protein